MERERFEREPTERTERQMERDRLEGRNTDRLAEQWTREGKERERDAERHRLALKTRDELADLESNGKIEYTERRPATIGADELIIDSRKEAIDSDRRRHMIRMTNRANENAFLEKQRAIDEIERDPELRETASFSTDDNPIEVLEYKGNYFVEEGSFERVRRAREMGLEDVPVHVRKAEPNS